MVVHRIDLETSGLVVFAKTADANRELSHRFRDHDLERAYLAAVIGRFPDETKLIDRPVGGRRAVTHVEIRERFGDRATLVACRLETGRTHQIRLHMVEVGTPVIGDARYGRSFAPAPPRMALARDQAGPRSPADGRAAVVREPLASRPGKVAHRNNVAQQGNAVASLPHSRVRARGAKVL